MKIGIITYTHGTNFGQRLQNYALQTTLEHIGHEPFTLQQKSPYGFKYEIRNAIKNKLIHCLGAVNFSFGQKPSWKRELLFDKFNLECIKFYPKKLNFNGDNAWANSIFDGFVVGSDQIWSPLSSYVGNNSFLTFAEDYKKLTYAPSLSVNELPEEKKDYYKSMLSHFPYISTREDTGARIIKKLINRDVTVVLDPTLLLSMDEWNHIRKKCVLKPEQKYILEMFLGGIPSDIEVIEKTMNLQIIKIDASTPISPDEFIDLVADAEYILTDSFHATIFSVLYHKPFINYSRSDYGDVMNTRFDTLYRIFGIGSRQWETLKQLEIHDISMDFEAIDKNILLEKEKSIAFLKKELSFLEH